MARVFDTALGNWPGNNTPYRIQVTDKGTRAAFQNAFADLASKLKQEDLLFIHTNNHGDNDSNGSFLCSFLHGNDPAPNEDGDFDYYYASEFASDISILPHYRALIVMMEQCNSGGFNYPILNVSSAESTSISASAPSYLSSYSSADGNWNVFAYEWLSAMHGSYPNGSALASNPDTNHDGVVNAMEAYVYAVANDSPDTPQLNNSLYGATLTLDQYYAFNWLWCWIFWPILKPIYLENFPLPTFPPQPHPDPDPYYAVINRVLPEVQRLILPAFEKELGSLRSNLGREITPIFERAAKELENKV